MKPQAGAQRLDASKRVLPGGSAGQHHLCGCCADFYVRNSESALLVTWLPWLTWQLDRDYYLSAAAAAVKVVARLCGRRAL